MNPTRKPHVHTSLGITATLLGSFLVGSTAAAAASTVAAGELAPAAVDEPRLPDPGDEAPTAASLRGAKRHRLVFSNMVGLRGNPTALVDYLSIGYRFKLYDDVESRLLKNSHVSLLLEPRISPAEASAGGVLEIEPLALVRLRVGYRYGTYFGTFNYIQSYRDSDQDYSDTALRNGSEAGKAYATTGGQFTAEILVQAAVGPVAVRNQLVFDHFDFDLHSGDKYFYEPSYDMLLADRAWACINNADVLYLSSNGLKAGVRYTMTRAFYDTPAGTEGSKNSPTHRAGPLVAYTFYEDPTAAIDSPTVLLLLNWWLSHRFRTGQDVSQSIPYAVLGFAFSGDLL